RERWCRASPCTGETRTRSRSQGKPHSIQYGGRTWMDETVAASAGKISCRCAHGGSDSDLAAREGPRHCRGLWPASVADRTRTNGGSLAGSCGTDKGCLSSRETFCAACNRGV